ncbi:hypothetical protein DKM19_20655 [Streptosporangium sp. 'caverna']|nr:hypothetical protein DKM19_20655 [Streptosporangium sp. 'caverna']
MRAISPGGTHGFPFTSLLALTFKTSDLHGLLLRGDVAEYIRLVDRRQQAAVLAELGPGVGMLPAWTFVRREIT